MEEWMTVVLWIMAWILLVCVASWVVIELMKLWIGKPMDVIEAETDVARDDDEYRRKQ
jgi:hypothetical protein